MPWRDAQQLVMVTTADWNATTGTLQRYQRHGGSWQAVGTATPITVGRAGSAWGIGLHPAQGDGPQKQEGDGRAPAGVFAIGTAFGYADRAATDWPYQAMTASDWCIDVNGSPLKLTSHEFRLLAYLMHHMGEVVSRTELVEHLYDQDFDRDSNTIEVFVGRLRKKMGVDMIETVRGMGYRIREPEA